MIYFLAMEKNIGSSTSNMYNKEFLTKVTTAVGIRYNFQSIRQTKKTYLNNIRPDRRMSPQIYQVQIRAT